MANVFVSYRRRDSRASTGRIADRLRAHFGESAIFQDIESIGLGVDFRAALMERLDKADVFLAIIGDQWLTAEDEGKRRIEQPDDPVRLEVAGALAREQIPVIPVLVGELPIPDVDDLPDDLKELHYRNAIQIPSDDTFDAQVTKLIGAIEKSIGTPPEVAKVSTDRSAAAAPTPAPAPVDHEPSSGSGSAKLIAIAAVLVLAAFALFQFRCDLLNQCPNIRFAFDEGSVYAMNYGETREIRLVAKNDKDEILEEVPSLEGRYDFVWANEIPKFLAVEKTDPDDPSARKLTGIPVDGTPVGASKLTVFITVVDADKTQRPPPLTVTISYDEALTNEAAKVLADIQNSEFTSKNLVDRITALVEEHRDALPPSTIESLEKPLPALTVLLDLRAKAESDDQTLTIGDRYALWTDWARKLQPIRTFSAEQMTTAWSVMEQLKTTTRLKGGLQTFSTCSREASCSGEKSTFRVGDKLYFGWNYVRASASGSEQVTIKMQGYEDKQVEIERQDAFTWTWVTARTAHDNLEIQLLNDNGDLIGTTQVTIR